MQVTAVHGKVHVASQLAALHQHVDHHHVDHVDQVLAVQAHVVLPDADKHAALSTRLFKTPLWFLHTLLKHAMFNQPSCNSRHVLVNTPSTRWFLL